MDLCVPSSVSSLQRSVFSRALNVAPAHHEPGELPLQDMLVRFRAQVAALMQEQTANRSSADIAVVFLAPGHPHRCAQDRRVQEHFSRASGAQLFEPFDALASSDAATTVCYILRLESASAHLQHGQFDVYYCHSGSPAHAVQHFDIEFESLLRSLFSANYRYVMKKADLRS